MPVLFVGAGVVDGDEAGEDVEGEEGDDGDDAAFVSGLAGALALFESPSPLEPLGALAEAFAERESVTYQPLPLNTMPTG